MVAAVQVNQYDLKLLLYGYLETVNLPLIVTVYSLLPEVNPSGKSLTVASVALPPNVVVAIAVHQSTLLDFVFH
jgi:hypothetical protein